MNSLTFSKDSNESGENINIIPFILYLFNNSKIFVSSISYISNFILYLLISRIFNLCSLKLEYSLNISDFPDYLSPNIANLNLYILSIIC